MKKRGVPRIVFVVVLLRVVVVLGLYVSRLTGFVVEEEEVDLSEDNGDLLTKKGIDGDKSERASIDCFHLPWTVKGLCYSGTVRGSLL